MTIEEHKQLAIVSYQYSGTVGWWVLTGFVLWLWYKLSGVFH